MPVKRVAIIHCDGGADKFGCGGWGVSAMIDGKHHELWAGEDETTNNRMELTGAIRGLEYLATGNRAASITIVSDSKYVVDGVNEYLDQWRARRWRTASNQVVKNLDLWRNVDILTRWFDDLEWKWVKGHSGVPGNEHADALATRGRLHIIETTYGSQIRTKQVVSDLQKAARNARSREER